MRQPATGNVVHRPLVGAVLVILVTSCLPSCAPALPSSATGGSSSPPASDVSSNPSGEASPSVDTGYTAVQIPGWDGEARDGRLFGTGRLGIVLSHMGRSGDSQEDWADEARRLADLGYVVLTYDRASGYSNVWREVLDGAAFLRSHGARLVVAGGASIGAMGSLYAAEHDGAALNGVIWVAGILLGSGYDFDRRDVARLRCPLLFISGDEDVYGAADDARQLDAWATAPHELLIVPSGEHGTDILAAGGRPADLMRAAIERYLSRMQERGGTCAG